MGDQVNDDDQRRRQAWQPGPGNAEGGWLALSDDDLLHAMAGLPDDHGRDEDLVRVVCSKRHFFVRQEAAKRIRDIERLKQHSHDRHIGQILVRSMNRREDVAYLEALVRETRYLEVRKAAVAQLRALAESRGQAE